MIYDLSAIIWGVTSKGAWAGIIALSLACIAFSIFLYARQGRLVPRFWRTVMLTLRAAALLVICISILQPTAVSPLNPDRGGVAILIDRSRSMSAIDTGDDLTDQIATATALNLFPKRLQGSDANPFEQNDTLKLACKKLIAMNRLERAQAATASLVRQLPSSVPIYGALFDSKLTPVVLRKDGKFVWPANITPSADQSDISGAVRQLLNNMGDNRLRAILLLTDGRQVGGTLGAISPETSPPIFPILCAGKPRDLVLSKIIALAHAYLDEPIAIESQIRFANLADIPVKLILRAGNLKETTTLHLDHAGAASVRSIIPMHRSGEQLVTLQLAPIPGEASEQNNRAELRVRVSLHRMKIALLASFPNRDFQFLRQQLNQTSWIDSTVILPGQSISADQLRQQNIIILNDLAAQQLNASQWDAIRESAAQNHAGLILIAGGNHLPSEYLNNPRLSSLLPFDIHSGQPVWRAWAGADAYFRFLPADTDAPFLRLFDDDSFASHQWDRLPAMYHYLQMPPLRPTAQPLLFERESAAPVLTQMPLGNGRVIFVGFNETWRWRSLSVPMQQRFWLQLCRHAVPQGDKLQEQSQPAELADLMPQTSLLSRLSPTHELTSLADVPTLWKKIQQYEQSHPEVTEYPLWHSPWLFALVLGCLGTEWALRKRFGLA